MFCRFFLETGAEKSTTWPQKNQVGAAPCELRSTAAGRSGGMSCWVKHTKIFSILYGQNVVMGHSIWISTCYIYIYNNIDIYIIYIYNVHTHISEVSWSFLRVSPSSLLLAMLRFRDSAWNPSRWGACLSSLPKRCAGVDCHWNRHSLAGKIHWNSKLTPEVFILFHLCIFLKTMSPIGEDSDVP